MKNAFNTILILTVVGFIALIAGALYFGAPAFGWIIMIAIMAVYLVEQFSAIRKMKQIIAEDEVIDSCEKGNAYPEPGTGVVAKRIELAKRLLQKNIRLDSPIAFDVLSSGSSIPLNRSVGSTVILLGLMGTFFGLMQSVATAGGAIDNSTTQGTLDTIQVLFQNMKGIFGTSLCGLFAALILSASRTVLSSKRDEFMAHLDSFTLDMQKDESAEGVIEEDKNELERLFESVEKNLSVIASSVKEGLAGVVSMVGEELSAMTSKLNQDVVDSVQKVSTEMTSSIKTVNDSLAGAVANMNESTQKFGELVGASVTNAFSPINENIGALSKSVEAIPSKLDDKLNGISAALNASLDGLSAGVKSSLDGVASDVKAGLDGVASDVKAGLQDVAKGTMDVAYLTKDAMDEASKSIGVSVAEQVKQSSEQWADFMQRLEDKTTANVDSQREGLETLKNVALQVAEKAQAGSAELSQNISEKLGALSSDILGAFQKLSETSSVLLEAQKALTESIDNRVVKEKEATDALGGNIVETAELMRVNQSELSANLEMLRSGLETILEKLSGDTAEHEEEDNFVEHLNQSLEAFHERASEVLMENAVKTQEILLEVLEQTQRSAIPAQPKAEG
ncbi:fimbrial protein [Fibrobacter sp. UWB3]|uniref:fimbrial protein n=1 Tax=Fibrobacter sp. UWB3 TaxID=1964357 RepID=UPI000B523F31|nr:fimbrial protein [Fibrobacter sp. UWB3]OWV16688.1 fimbrial protein [Fibrobacter sp. UWB3]